MRFPRARLICVMAGTASIDTNERRCYAGKRSHLPCLRARDDVPNYDRACVRRRFERVPMQAVWVFNDRTGKLDKTTLPEFRQPVRRNPLRVPSKGIETALQEANEKQGSAAAAGLRSRAPRLWLASLKRRSQTARLSWEKFIRLVARFFPPIRTLHPLPRPIKSSPFPFRCQNRRTLGHPSSHSIRPGIS